MKTLFLNSLRLPVRGSLPVVPFQKRRLTTTDHGSYESILPIRIQFFNNTNMKQLTSLIALVFGLTINVLAQSDKQNELHLYGAAGVKWLQPKTFAYDKNVSPSLASVIGGGAIWQKGKAQLGAEFGYTNATSHLSGHRYAYSGVSINFIGGYRFDLSQRYKLSLQSGLGYSLNHMYVTDQSFTSVDYLNTAVFHNNSYTIPLAVMLQRVHTEGTFIGIKAGYNFHVSGNEWKYMEGVTRQHFSADPEGLYVQLIFGGLLKLD